MSRTGAMADGAPLPLSLASYRVPRRTAPIRALSPNHGVDLPPAYFDLVLEKAQRYGFNHLHYANWAIEDDFDQFVRYEGIPGLAEAIGAPRVHVEERVAQFRTVTAKARAAGIETYIWHHELNFPAALARLHPEGFLPGEHRFPGDAMRPIPNLDAPVIWDFMRARLEEAYRKLPDLTGLILVVQESNIPIYHLSQDPATRIAHTRRLLDFMHAEHRRLGRKWILRAFCWREWEYATLREALRGFDPEVPVEIKATPMDWQLFYPHDGLIAALGGERQTLVEMDFGAQFWGECEVPAINSAHYADELLFALEHGCSGAVLRTDRKGQHAFDKPIEMNLAVAGALLQDPGRPLADIERGWLDATYGAAAPAAQRLFRHAWEVVRRLYFVDGSWTIDCHHNSQARGSCNLFVGERELAFEPGDEGFRREIELAELHIAAAERELADALAAAGHAPPAPAAMPATLRNHIAPAPHPLDELARQVRNLRQQHDFFSAFKEFLYALRVRTYDRSPEALAAGQAWLERMAQLLAAAPHLQPEQPDAVARYGELLHGIAPREILCGRHFSQGMAFHGRSYVVPHPQPVVCRLPVRPGASNILMINVGTHMCREAVAEVTVDGQRFELRRGTMSWFWAYDGWKRWELVLPAALCASGGIEVRVQAADPTSAPLISEIRTEVEGDGLKPRFE